MKDEEIIGSDSDFASEVWLFDRWINDFVFMVFKDAEETIEADINARGLDHLRVEWFDLDPASLNFGGDIAVAKEHSFGCYLFFRVKPTSHNSERCARILEFL
jgi:hypothetical protein